MMIVIWNKSVRSCHEKDHHCDDDSRQRTWVPPSKRKILLFHCRHHVLRWELMIDNYFNKTQQRLLGVDDNDNNNTATQQLIGTMEKKESGTAGLLLVQQQERTRHRRQSDRSGLVMVMTTSEQFSKDAHTDTYNRNFARTHHHHQESENNKKRKYQ